MSGKPSAVYRNRMERYADTVWLIWSNKRGCWYRAESSGYTSDVAQAGTYTRAEAARHMSIGPKKYRDTEPFPLSCVKAYMRRRVAALVEQNEALIAHLTAFVGSVSHD